MSVADPNRSRPSVGRPLLFNGVLLFCVLVLTSIVLWQNRPRWTPPPEASQPAAPTAAAAAQPTSVSSERVEPAPEPTPAPTGPAAVTEHAAPAKAAVSISPPNAPASPPTVVSDGRSAEELATIRIFNAVSPAVVHIATQTLERDDFSLNVMEVPQGTGTGFVWDREGHVVTNFHVIEGASGAQVALGDHSTWPAKLVGAAPDKDLAVLKIEAPADRLHTIPLGTSSNLQVGQKSLAIGNPFGLDHTLTSGIISALGREIASRTGRPIKGVIQTDAAINPGNSGGPLLDGSGQLIGMTTAIVSPSGAYAGIGFAIPVDTIR